VSSEVPRRERRGKVREIKASRLNGTKNGRRVKMVRADIGSRVRGSSSVAG